MRINEDILNQCINESIDEFMLEEGWGDAFKKVGSYLKDGFNAWMNWGTNGEYGKQFDARLSNNRFNETYFLNQWFGYQVKEINKYCEYYRNKPDNYWLERISKYVREYVTPQAFNTWAQGQIKDRIEQGHISNYISYCQRTLLDVIPYDPNMAVEEASNLLNINSFFKSRYGQLYLKRKQSIEQAQKDELWRKHQEEEERQMQNNQQQVQRPNNQQPQMNNQQSQANNQQGTKIIPMYGNRQNNNQQQVQQPQANSQQPQANNQQRQKVKILDKYGNPIN